MKWDNVFAEKDCPLSQYFVQWGDNSCSHIIFLGIKSVALSLSSQSMQPIIIILWLCFSRSEASNKPSVQRSCDKIKQTASQTWCLLRFLPQLVGHLVPEDHLGWRVYLLLRSIMDLIFSPAISYAASFVVEALVEEHHHLFKEVGAVVMSADQFQLCYQFLLSLLKGFSLSYTCGFRIPIIIIALHLYNYALVENTFWCVIVNLCVFPLYVYGVQRSANINYVWHFSPVFRHILKLAFLLKHTLCHIMVNRSEETDHW